MLVKISKQDILYLREFQKLVNEASPGRWKQVTEWCARRDWFNNFMKRFDGKA